MRTQGWTATLMALLTVGILAAAQPALAQSKLVCKFGVLGTPDSTTGIGMQRMADRINAGSKGEIDVQIFPNSQLGGEKEMAEGMRLGSVLIRLMPSRLFLSMGLSCVRASKLETVQGCWLPGQRYSPSHGQVSDHHA
ncbi:MAG: hypothetical protein EBT05_14915 [Betaproteobacteria bacterium]|nr:hypothetical protein [Betaproteobacteria bacterium]